MVVDGQEDQDIAARTFLAHLPLIFKCAGKFGRVVAIQCADCNHGNLRIGLRVVKLGAKRVQPRHGLWRQHVGKVADVICGLRQVLNLFSLNSNGGNGNASCHKQQEDSEMCAAKALHRFLLYGYSAREVPQV